MTRTALLRAAVAPLLATALGGSLLGGSLLGGSLLGGSVLGGSVATPALAGPPMVLAAAPADDTADPDRPVQIEIGRFEPRTVTPGATVTVAGTLTNTGDETITDLTVRLQRGDVLTTRAELAGVTANPDPAATTVLPPFQDVPGSLAPGAELDFSYSVGSDQLRLDRDGVYPVLLNVNGIAGDAGEEEQRRVGELPTFVVQQPVVPTARTAVAWLWPLQERTHRDASGGFVDDDLTAAVREGGRLDRALAVVERIPGTLAPGGNQAVPALQVTLAVDPALVEELTLMAAGPYAVDGVDGAGEGTDEAAAFLERLRVVAAVHPVVALPYGDVDADTLVTAGLTDAVVRSLPGTPEGTAEDPPGSADDEAADVTTPPADESGAADPGTADDDTSAGARILGDALDVEPRTDLVWAPGGTLRPETLRTLQAGGVEEVVLGSEGLTGGDAAVGLADGTAAARTAVDTASGPIGGLIADGTLGQVVGSAERATGGPRLAEQRYLAELAVLTLQAPAGTEQTVLVAPARGVDAGPEGAGAMMADTAGLPWLRPSTLAELSGGPTSVTRGQVGAGDAGGLDPTGLADVVAAVAVRDDLADAVVGDADAALAAYDAAIARTTSTAWRGDPEGFRDAATGLGAALDRLRGRVTLVAPADGTYSLGSSEAPLVLTVRNDLPMAVQVRLQVSARGGRGLSIADIGVQTLAPGQRTTLQVPTEVRQSGGFAVTAQLTTPDGQPLGDRIQLQVKSTAYGSISLLITIGAAALLALLFLRRLVNFLLRRRRAAAAASAELGAPEGAAVSQPPNRSPV
jgi:hypothetical protein